NELILWDLASHDECFRFHHPSTVSGVAFSPDGRRLASCCEDSTIIIWEVATGQDILRLHGHRTFACSVAFSRDGTRLATGSFDRTIRIWDGRPWDPEAASDWAAIGLLDYLFARPLEKGDVLDYVRDSDTIPARARQMALSSAEFYHEERDPERYHEATRKLVREQYLNSFQYRFALKQAQTACRLAPDKDRFLTTLGMAQYRTGKYQEAMGTLTRADQRRRDQPANLAFLAMTHFRLGDKEKAQTTLAKLRQIMKSPQWSRDEEAQDLMSEVEAIILTALHGE